MLRTAVTAREWFHCTELFAHKARTSMKNVFHMFQYIPGCTWQQFYVENHNNNMPAACCVAMGID